MVEIQLEQAHRIGMRKFSRTTFENERGESFSVGTWTASPSASAIPNAALCIVHGSGEHIGRYYNVAAALDDVGVPIIGYDHRGHGESDGKRGHAANLDELVDDLEYFLEHFAVRQSRLEQVVLMGHSLGGAVVAHYATRRRVHSVVKSIVLSSPALAIPRSPLTVAKIWMAWVVKNIAPSFVMPTPVDVAWITTDEQEMKKFASDPLVHHSISASLGYSVIVDGEAVTEKENAQNISLPLLIWHGTDDKICDISGTKKLVQSVGTTPDALQCIYIEGAAHEVHNETPERRERVLSALKDWTRRYCS